MSQQLWNVVDRMLVDAFVCGVDGEAMDTLSMRKRFDEAVAWLSKPSGGMLTWQPIETAPKSYYPPLSQYNHHAPDILGLWGKSFYCVCSWGGRHNPFWIGGDNKPVPFQPTHWMPLPSAPNGDAP